MTEPKGVRASEYVARARGAPAGAQSLEGLIGIYEGSPDAATSLDRALYGGPDGK